MASVDHLTNPPFTFSRLKTVTADLLSIDYLREHLSEKALTYLTTTIPEHHRIGVGDFVVAQRRLFNQHAGDLAAVLMALEQAPSDLNLKHFESCFIEWLRENGVSRSRITQLKGAIRIKRRALAEGSFYDQSEREFIKELEVEKAYLFGRLTWEGQKQAFQLRQSSGKITLQDLRQLLKVHQYDPKSQWQGSDEWSPSKGKSDPKPSPTPAVLSLPISTKAYDLALMLQGVVDQLLDIHPQWEGDHRITELVDARRLSELTNQLCAGRDLGWDF
jgi:hypothetical protein